mmetsp:Transcript_21797/g.47593  ORF Transcript_21797/g.47593 Transcript_21797/m.47593 type:complete len:181 (-) Transcript_21797:154-696(-)
MPAPRLSLVIAAVAAALACVCGGTDAFSPVTTIAPAAHASSMGHRSSDILQLNMVEQIDLQAAINDDHEAEGERMAASITGWLDVEWYPQSVHVDMAQSAKSSYIAARTNGEHGISDVLHRVADDLDRDWSKYDKDAFVNAWDIGNYVADYLTQRAGGESCGCHATIFDPEQQQKQTQTQ